MWTDSKTSVRSNLRGAFADLRKKGYFARMNFWCCQSCAWADVPEGMDDKVVFYHAQDAQDMNDRWGYFKEVYLAWAGDCNEIREAFENRGFVVDHDGTHSTRIIVKRPVATAGS